MLSSQVTRDLRVQANDPTVKLLLLSKVFGSLLEMNDFVTCYYAYVLFRKWQFNVDLRLANVRLSSVGFEN